MDQVLSYLDAHSGSVIVFVTLAYVLITALLLFEARANRAMGDVANLEADARPHGPVYVELVVQNYGPAIAKSVRFRRWIEIDGVTVAGTDRTQAEPMFPVGRRRRFLPSMQDGQIDTLSELAERKAVLRAEWSWTDLRRSWWVRTKTNRGSLTFPCENLRDGFYGGWALVEREQSQDDEQSFQELQKLRGAVEEIGKTLSSPATAFYIRKMLDDGKAREAAAEAGAEQAEDPSSEDQI